MSKDARSRDRHRRARWNAAGNALSAAAGLLSLIVVTRLTLPALGPERFGLWMSIASVAGMLSFLDLGIGNGMVNMVARARARDGVLRISTLVRRGMGVLTCIGVAAGICLTALIDLLPSQQFFKLSDATLAAEARQTALVFAWLFAASIPLSGVQRVFFGLQAAWVAHAVKTAGYLAAPGLTYLLLQRDAGLPALLAATYGLQTLLPVVLLPVLSRWMRESTCSTAPERTVPLRQDLRELLSISGLFLALQVGVMVGWGSDALIAASLLGTAAVAPLFIVQRIFQFVTIPLGILNGPMWAAYADAHALGDHRFIRTTLARYLTVTAAVAVVGSTLLALSAGWITEVWLGLAHLPPHGLIVAFAAWTALEAVGNCFAMYLNGCGMLKPQVTVVLLFCAVALPLKFLLPEHLGISGVVIATLAAYLTCVALPYATWLNAAVTAPLRWPAATSRR